jgi:hypothetical protein
MPFAGPQDNAANATARALALSLAGPEDQSYRLLKKSAFFRVKLCHLAGTSASRKIAETGQAGSHAAQSMQVTGSMYICSSSGPPCMQSTGQTSTQASSFAPMHGSQITNAKPDAPYPFHL